MEHNPNMEQEKQKQRRKNLLVGWAIGILAITFYVAAIYFN
jgi:hypothetical protein